MHPAKTSGFYCHEKGEEGISEYSHCVPRVSKQEALQLSWHDLPRDYEEVAGKTEPVGTGNRNAIEIIRTSS